MGGGERRLVLCCVLCCSPLKVIGHRSLELTRRFKTLEQQARACARLGGAAHGGAAYGGAPPLVCALTKWGAVGVIRLCLRPSDSFGAANRGDAAEVPPARGETVELDGAAA